MKSASKKDEKTTQGEPTNQTPAPEPVNQTPAPAAPPVQDEKESFVSKLSIKALGCNPQLPKDVAAQVLCIIHGTAQGLKHGEDKNSGNVWTALQGSFEGTNTETGSKDYGKRLRSGKLFLPAGIQDVIEGALREIENTAGGKENPNVVFALEIRSVKATNRIGYSYEARNLMPVVAVDPLAQMRETIEQSMGKPMLQIAAPETTTS